MKPDRDPRPGLPSTQERSRTGEPLRRKPEPRRVDLESIRRVVRNLDDSRDRLRSRICWITEFEIPGTAVIADISAAGLVAALLGVRMAAALGQAAIFTGYVDVPHLGTTASHDVLALRRHSQL